MSRRYILLLTAAILTVTSCTGNATKDALESLDRTIDSSHVWRNAFMEQTGLLRERFEKAGKDSLWEMADSMHMAYMHWQSDSSSRYLRLMQEYASTDREKCLTGLAEVRMRLTMCDIWTAYRKFSSADTSVIYMPEVLKEYLATGISVYYNLSRLNIPDKEKAEYSDRLDRLRSRYISIFPDSMEGMRYKAQHLRETGETENAIAIFHYLHSTQTDYHTLASISYNLAAIYGDTGDREKAMMWLAMAAEYDFKTPDRNYLSLYDLAMMCYEEGMLEKAQRYINQNMTDIIEGNISSRIFNSSQAHLVMEDAARQERNMIYAIILTLSGIIGIMSIILCIMLRNSRKANRMLQASNRALQDSNLIKDSYVFRYMSLSIEYLERIGDIRSKLRQTAKNEGVDAMMKQLKSPEEMYAEYDRFYRIFDEIFLGIYPDFVRKVNRLLKDDCQLSQPQENVLTTELRILAAMRIGITQSGKIATFLKCSPATVYTYRTRLRNNAKCSKDEFEEVVRRL
ncbi:MAG: DUF6377 domain-containing protein [Bacteroidales bacterium]|nr:DUF6377 domain-containing protein [Bacteroidales bacterium]